MFVSFAITAIVNNPMNKLTSPPNPKLGKVENCAEECERNRDSLQQLQMPDESGLGAWDWSDLALHSGAVERRII